MAGRSQQQLHVYGFRDIFQRLSPVEEQLVQLSRRVNETMLGDAVFRAEAAIDLFSRNRFVSDSNIVVLERALGLCESLMTNIEQGLEAALAEGGEIHASVAREAHERWQLCNELAIRVKKVIDDARPVMKWGGSPRRFSSPVKALSSIALHSPRRHRKAASALGARRKWQRFIATLGLRAGNAAFEQYLSSLPETALREIEMELSVDETD